ncbi:hypothetical protein R6Q59_019115 [Mikania micrantha]
MNPHPTLTILEQSKVMPPPATIGCKSLPLTFSDMLWLTIPEPVHILFFYELSISKTHFTQTIVPNLKQSLSTTLQHFFPYVGKLNIFRTCGRLPEIRYVDGDSVDVTIAECNLDFSDLTGNHPRKCDKFYHLIPLLGRVAKVSDHATIPVFAVQVTLFPNSGVSIGMTYLHSLGDARTTFNFRKAWASIAQSGSDESFLAQGTLPVFERLLNYHKLDESLSKIAKAEIFDKVYKLRKLSGPTDKVRATFILTRTVINGLKKLVTTQLPTLAYISSFTVTCAYTWSCLAKLHNEELAMFLFAVDCRTRIDPPIPAAYFGNCITPCVNLERTTVLKDKEGFLTAARLIGDNLNKKLADVKDELVRDRIGSITSLVPEVGPTTKMTGVAGTPKLRFYDFDLGFGKPVKHETISIDYNGSISISASRESNEDLEIGVCLSANEMNDFVGYFNYGLESMVS